MADAPIADAPIVDGPAPIAGPALRSLPSVANQVALVTGASSGIGRAAALALGAAGAMVVVNHLRDDAAADAVVAEIQHNGGKALALEADVSDESDVQRMFAAAIQQFASVHILVNNAGIQRDSAFVDMTLADWQRVIDVNLTGQFLCAREAAREFIRHGVDEKLSAAAGKIVAVSSVHETIPWAGHANYAASKGGVMLLTKTMAQELAPHRIRVNAVAPGAIRTNINRAAWETPAAQQELLKFIPYGRVGDAADIARAIVWLASDDSDYVTGTCLPVDGGMLLYPAFGNGKG